MPEAAVQGNTAVRLGQVYGGIEGMSAHFARDAVTGREMDAIGGSIGLGPTPPGFPSAAETAFLRLLEAGHVSTTKPGAPDEVPDGRDAQVPGEPPDDPGPNTVDGGGGGSPPRNRPTASSASPEPDDGSGRAGRSPGSSTWGELIGGADLDIDAAITICMRLYTASPDEVLALPQEIKDAVYAKLRSVRTELQPSAHDLEELNDGTARLLQHGAQFPPGSVLTAADANDITMVRGEVLARLLTGMTDVQISALPPQMLVAVASQCIDGYGDEFGITPLRLAQADRVRDLIPPPPFQAAIDRALVDYLPMGSMRCVASSSGSGLERTVNYQVTPGNAPIELGWASRGSIPGRVAVDLQVSRMQSVGDDYTLVSHGSERQPAVQLPGSERSQSLVRGEPILVPAGTLVQIGRPGDLGYAQFQLPNARGSV